MSDVPQTDVSRPSALPTANLQRTATSQSLVDQNSAEYLDAIEEEWNKRVDMEVETLVDGMVDLVTLASVSFVLLFWLGSWPDVVQIGDKDKFRIAQESFQAPSRAESMVRILEQSSDCHLIDLFRYEPQTRCYQLRIP
jgi:mediator of RNA polymerase II transcription subunit 22